MRRKLSANATLAALREGFRNSLQSPAALAMMAAPVIGLGVGAIDSRLRARAEARQKATAYRSMLDLHPHFKQRDPAEVNRIYNSLSNVSPTMARDPLVAGAWVDNVLESKGVGYNSHQGLLSAVKDLSGIESNLTSNATKRQHDTGGRVSSFIKGFGDQLETNAHGGLVNLAKQKTKEINESGAELNTRAQRFDEEASRMATAHRDRVLAAQGELQQWAQDLHNREQALAGHKTSSAVPATELDELFQALGV